jgi:hypothetical protein
MTHCATCQYWNADPNDNGMGECTGIPASSLVEINADAVDSLEVFTNAEFGCAIGLDKSFLTQ